MQTKTSSQRTSKFKAGRDPSDHKDEFPTTTDPNADLPLSDAGATPEKNENQLLKLLSSLEGLTPAGLEHLLETQDKLAAGPEPR